MVWLGKSLSNEKIADVLTVGLQDPALPTEVAATVHDLLVWAGAADLYKIKPASANDLS